MEPMTKSEAEMTPQSVKFTAGSYNITANLHNQKIHFEGYSQIARKFFQATITYEDLDEKDKGIFADIEAAFEMIEDCILDERLIELSDAGELNFSYELQATKKKGQKNKKVLRFQLIEKDIGPVEQLAIKVDRIEIDKNKLASYMHGKLAELEKGDKIQRLEKKDEELEVRHDALLGEVKKLTEENKRLSEEKNKLVTRIAELEKHERLVRLETRVGVIEKANVFEKIDPRIDTTTSYVSNLTVSGLEVFGNKGTGNYHPCFLTNRLEGKQYFEVDMVAYSSVQVWVGVAIEALRPNVNCYGSNGALSLDIANTRVYHSNGSTRTIVSLSYAANDRIMVKVDRINHTIEWEFVKPIIQPIVKISIPPDMRDKVLFPVVHIGGSGSDKVRFV